MSAHLCKKLSAIRFERICNAAALPKVLEHLRERTANYALAGVNNILDMMYFLKSKAPLSFIVITSHQVSCLVLLSFCQSIQKVVKILSR